MTLVHANRIETIGMAAAGSTGGSSLDPDAAELLSWQRTTEQQILALGSFLGQARTGAERGLEAMAGFAQLVGRAAEVSTTRLATAITTLPELSARDTDERRMVQSLQGELGVAHRSVQELSSRMTTLAQLALLARMETAALGEYAQGFEGFTSEVDGLVERAEQTVMALDGEIAKLLQGVGDIQRIDRRGGSAHVPDTVQRIGALLEKAAERRSQGTEAMAAVGALLERLRKETARLVTGLQFHDGMRQRLEHIGFGLERLRVVRLRGILADDDPAPLDGAQRRIAIGALCALQAAQLRDLAALVEQECSSVAASLEEMGRSVGQAEHLFRTAWGRSADDVMAELDEAVSGVATMVQGYAHVRGAMTVAREHALQGIERMAGLAADLDEVEMAIRMAGLNATFRSAQLGGVGGPMKCIAQELRGSAGQIGQAVAAFGTELATIAAAVGRLRDHAAADPIEQRAALTESLKEGAQALRQMDGEGDRLQELVGQALAGLAGTFQAQARTMAGLGGAQDMRALAVQLDELLQLEGQKASDGQLWPALDRLLKGIYTTKNERDVHQTMHGGTPGASSGPAAQPQEIDDILF